jgi:hypothetical protein
LSARKIVQVTVPREIDPHKVFGPDKTVWVICRTGATGLGEVTGPKPTTTKQVASKLERTPDFSYF